MNSQSAQQTFQKVHLFILSESLSHLSDPSYTNTSGDIKKSDEEVCVKSCIMIE
jgi:hypothetical protein